MPQFAEQPCAECRSSPQKHAGSLEIVDQEFQTNKHSYIELTDSDVILNLLKFLFHFFTIFDDGCTQPDEGDVVLEWIGGVVLRVEDDLVHLEVLELKTGQGECSK